MKDSENKLSGSMHSFKRMLSFGILMVIAMTLFAQVKNVSGVVLDKKGESIIGASVLVKVLLMVRLPILTVILF